MFFPADSFVKWLSASWLLVISSSSSNVTQVLSLEEYPVGVRDTSLLKLTLPLDQVLYVTFFRLSLLDDGFSHPFVIIHCERQKKPNQEILHEAIAERNLITK